MSLNVYCVVIVTTKFSDWLISTANSPCPGGVRAQCLSSGKLSIKELNLIDTTCSPLDKFKCGNQKKNDPDNQVRCPASMMIRYECPYNPSKIFPWNLRFAACIPYIMVLDLTVFQFRITKFFLYFTFDFSDNDCSSKNCNGRGSCMDSLSGYICLCRDGYTGKDCETSNTIQYYNILNDNWILIQKCGVGDGREEGVKKERRRERIECFFVYTSLFIRRRHKSSPRMTLLEIQPFNHLWICMWIFHQESSNSLKIPKIVPNS